MANTVTRFRDPENEGDYLDLEDLDPDGTLVDDEDLIARFTVVIGNDVDGDYKTVVAPFQLTRAELRELRVEIDAILGAEDEETEL